MNRQPLLEVYISRVGDKYDIVHCTSFLMIDFVHFNIPI